MSKKKISILIPTYNEEDNIKMAADTVSKIMLSLIDKYDYEIIFIDNFSTDQTRTLITKACTEDKRIKAIFNAKYFNKICPKVF